MSCLSKFSYEGCYKDDISDPDLPNKISDATTTKECYTKALEAKHKFFAM